MKKIHQIKKFKKLFIDLDNIMLSNFSFKYKVSGIKELTENYIIVDEISYSQNMFLKGDYNQERFSIIFQQGHEKSSGELGIKVKIVGEKEVLFSELMNSNIFFKSMIKFNKLLSQPTSDKLIKVSDFPKQNAIKIFFLLSFIKNNQVFFSNDNNIINF